MTPGEKTRRTDLRDQRRRRQHGCWDQLIVAPLWVADEANLGTRLRTCDAVGACMAVPGTDHYHRALDRGDTLPRRPHVHWVRRSKLTWIAEQRATSRIVAVELAEDATPLTRLATARTRTVVRLGHKHHGVPPEAWAGRRRSALLFERKVEDSEQDWRVALGRVRAGSAVELLLKALAGASILSVRGAAEPIGRSFQATNEAVRRLEGADVVAQVTVGRRNRAYEARAIIDAFAALERPLASRPLYTSAPTTPRIPPRPEGGP